MAKSSYRGTTLADHAEAAGRELCLGMSVIVGARRGVVRGVTTKGVAVEFGKGMGSSYEVVRACDLGFLENERTDHGE